MFFRKELYEVEFKKNEMGERETRLVAEIMKSRRELDSKSGETAAESQHLCQPGARKGTVSFHMGPSVPIMPVLVTQEAYIVLLLRTGE